MKKSDFIGMVCVGIVMVGIMSSLVYRETTRWNLKSAKIDSQLLPKGSTISMLDKDNLKIYLDSGRWEVVSEGAFTYTIKCIADKSIEDDKKFINKIWMEKGE